MIKDVKAGGKVWGRNFTVTDLRYWMLRKEKLLKSQRIKSRDKNLRKGTALNKGLHIPFNRRRTRQIKNTGRRYCWNDMHGMEGVEADDIGIVDRDSLSYVEILNGKGDQVMA